MPELSGFFFVVVVCFWGFLNVAAAPEAQVPILSEGLTAWAQGLGLSPSERPEDDYLLKLASQYHAEQYEDSYRQMSESLATLILLLLGDLCLILPWSMLHVLLLQGLSC